MEQWVDGLAALLGLQGSCGSHSNPLSTLQDGQEGLSRVASGLESISALPRQHSAPLPWSCGQHIQCLCLSQTLQCCKGKVFSFSLLCRQQTCLGSAWLCLVVADGRPMGAQGPCSCSDPSWVCPEPTDRDWLGHVSSGGCGELPARGAAGASSCWDGVSSLGAGAGMRPWQSACLGLLPLLQKAHQRGNEQNFPRLESCKWDQGLSDTCDCTRRGHVLYCLRK